MGVEEVKVTITMAPWQAVLLILSPVIAIGFRLFTEWADRQFWIEEWLARRRGR